MISGDECGLNSLTFVLQLGKEPGKNLHQETDPIGNQTLTRWMRGNDVTSRPQRWLTCFPSHSLLTTTHTTSTIKVKCLKLTKTSSYFNLFYSYCTAFEVIDGAQIILKSQNEATAHDQRSDTWFTSAQVFEKLKSVLFHCVPCKGK